MTFQNNAFDVTKQDETREIEQRVAISPEEIQAYLRKGRVLRAQAVTAAVASAARGLAGAAEAVSGAAKATAPRGAKRPAAA